MKQASVFPTRSRQAKHRHWLPAVIAATVGCTVAPAEDMDGADATGEDANSVTASTESALTRASEITGYPEVVKVSFPNEDQSSGHCTASVITDRVLLTAAHCVEQVGAEGYSGKHLRTEVSVSTGATTGMRTRRVFDGNLRVTMHPRFSIGGEGAYDLAILTTDPGVTIPGVRPSRLYSGAWAPWSVGNVDALSTRLQFQAVGYGAGSDGKECFANPEGIKRFGTMIFGDVYPTRTPQRIVGHPDPSWVCGGDSGSPALFNDMVFGVASYLYSWKSHFGSRQYRSNYAVIHSNLDWLKSAVAARGIAMRCDERGSDYSTYYSDKHLVCTQGAAPTARPTIGSATFDGTWFYLQWNPVPGAIDYTQFVIGTKGGTQKWLHRLSGGASDRGSYLYEYYHRNDICAALGTGTFSLSAQVWTEDDPALATATGTIGTITCP
jgi:hypothetical protein